MAFHYMRNIFFPFQSQDNITLSPPTFSCDAFLCYPGRDPRETATCCTSQEYHQVHSELAAHIWEEMFPEKFLYLLPSMLLCGRVLDSLSPPVDAWDHKGDP